MNWIYAILKMIGLLPKAKRYATGHIYTYSLPNLWWILSDGDYRKWFSTMAKNGMNATLCELNRATSWLGNIKAPTMDEYINHAFRIHDAAQLYGIKVIWSYNWNNSNIANMSDQDLIRVMGALPRKDCGFEMGEWDGSRNTDRENDAQAQRICEKAEEIWPTLNIWNRGSRPKTGPSDNEYVCQHLADKSQKCSNAGARYIACTDHSILLDQLGNGGREFQKWTIPALREWSTKMMMNHNSVHWYHFMGKEPDYDALNVIGDVIEMYGGK